jgi:hypothetical protein
MTTWLVWGTYGALAVAIALFAITIELVRPDVGVVASATLLLGVVGTVAGVVLLSGSVRHAGNADDSRRMPGHSS